MFHVVVQLAGEDHEERYEFDTEAEARRFIWLLTEEDPNAVYELYGQAGPEVRAA